MLSDVFDRRLRNLRLSITDRCNLRCHYCMPERDYVWLPREDFLSFEEMSVLVDEFVGLGVDRVRVTGGEPLLRRDVAALVSMIAGKSGVREVALTTNGVLLAKYADALRSAGLARITVSLDTLRRERFAALTRNDRLDAVLEGIAAAHREFGHLKLDTVVMRGVNDDELVPLLEYSRSVNAEIRFIEYMDVGGANQWAPARVFPRSEILAVLAREYGTIAPLHEAGSTAPAQRFTLKDGTTFGIIASTTAPFCATCDRSRLTADGMWYLCLYARHGFDLRGPLRRGVPRDRLRGLITAAWQARDDRGAEQRLHLGERRAFVPLQDIRRKDPHLEMHTRGG